MNSAAVARTDGSTRRWPNKAIASADLAEQLSDQIVSAIGWQRPGRAGWRSSRSLRCVPRHRSSSARDATARARRAACRGGRCRPRRRRVSYSGSARSGRFADVSAATRPIRRRPDGAGWPARRPLDLPCCRFDPGNIAIVGDHVSVERGRRAPRPRSRRRRGALRRSARDDTHRPDRGRSPRLRDGRSQHGPCPRRCDRPATMADAIRIVDGATTVPSPRARSTSHLPTIASSRSMPRQRSRFGCAASKRTATRPRRRRSPTGSSPRRRRSSSSSRSVRPRVGSPGASTLRTMQFGTIHRRRTGQHHRIVTTTPAQGRPRRSIRSSARRSRRPRSASISPRRRIAGHFSSTTSMVRRTTLSPATQLEVRLNDTHPCSWIRSSITYVAPTRGATIYTMNITDNDCSRQFNLESENFIAPSPSPRSRVRSNNDRHRLRHGAIALQSPRGRHRQGVPSACSSTPCHFQSDRAPLPGPFFGRRERQTLMHRTADAVRDRSRSCRETLWT